MPFDITIGTETANELQNAIQAELLKRGYTQDASDQVMAEYITIMLINNKTAEQITAELQDLIGASEYDASFTGWLFAEATKLSEPPTATQSTPTSPAATTQAEPQSPQTIRRVPPPRTGPAPLYNHALNQALPSGSQSSQKRTASARSPSPTQGPNKSRRTDVPTGPRAMQRDRDGGRSLLDRMGGRQRGVQGAQVRDEIQARIDAVTHGGGVPPQEMMGGPMNGFNNGMAPAMMPMMPGPDMSAMMNSMNPMALQELMMNQMALMAQMANNIGILNAQQGQLLQQQQQQKPQPGPGAHQGDGNRRGGGPSGRGRGRGGAWTGGSTTHVQQDNASTSPAATTSTTPSELNPTAPVFTPSASTSSPAQQPGISPPSRPQSPTLCKFGAKCVNALCRYSHPSPVATTESGVVLSNDACENGKNCKDKDCIKAHVSPAAVGVSKVAGPAHKPEAPPVPAPVHAPVPQQHPHQQHQLQIPCRYGANCIKQNAGCPYLHPSTSHFSTPCKFGAACTRANCAFQHPPGRVLPNTFHRGLGTNTPNVTLHAPETGSIGGSMNRSVVFNKPGEVKKKPEETVDEQETKGPSTVEATA